MSTDHDRLSESSLVKALRRDLEWGGKCSTCRPTDECPWCERRTLANVVLALKAELAEALVDAEKWRAQQRDQSRRDDAAERGGDW